MELKELMKGAGIVGAGGAGFPSYAKLAGGADTLLINGAECEPLLYTDYVILKRELSLVLSGIDAVRKELSIPRAILAVKAHTAKRLSLTDGECLSEKITVKVLPDVYPIGDEISLIFEATGRVVRPGNLPITKGVIIYNVETMYNLGASIRLGTPVTMKWLTLGGDIDSPCVVRVPVGTRISDLFARFNIAVGEGRVVIEGGPSMGQIINPETASVKKTTKGILVLPEGIQASQSKKMNEKMAVARAETACCQCTRCTDMCPRHLLGYPLEPHKMVRTAMGAVTVSPEMVISATLCCSCGVCESLACSQGISPRAVINNYKALLAKNKMRYSGKEDVFPSFEREYRKIPSDKWASTLGVKRFDTVCDFGGEISDFARVEISLSQSIGAPSVPCVSDGDLVSSGDLIAESAEGLSLPIHASIPGRVTLGTGKIIIEKVR